MTSRRSRRTIGIALILGGFALQMFGILWVSPNNILLTLLDIASLIGGVIVYFVGCGYYATSKGYEWYFGVLGMLSILGILFLVFMPDRECTSKPTSSIP